ncbi:MAG: DUF2782 domain-containing protein [Burkholderiaceae bacterium]
MNPRPPLILFFAFAPCWAQSAPDVAPPAVVEAAPVERPEPTVQHTVIEDDGSKIDELRVRGQVRHIVVTPKVGTDRSYEIVVNRSGKDVGEGIGGATGAVGKRVWNVLDF